MAHGWSTRVHEGRRHEGVGHKDSTFLKRWVRKRRRRGRNRPKLFLIVLVIVAVFCC